MFESSCIKEILNPFNPKDCENCYASREIYVFWTEMGKSYIQKLDNCSEYNNIEIYNFNVSKYMKNYSREMKNEEVKIYQTVENTAIIVSHSCSKKYTIFDGNLKYKNYFEYYNLTGKEENINYDKNNSLRIILLDTKLNKIIEDLENNKKFERDKKTCYN